MCVCVCRASALSQICAASRGHAAQHRGPLPAQTALSTLAQARLPPHTLPTRAPPQLSDSLPAPIRTPSSLSPSIDLPQKEVCPVAHVLHARAQALASAWLSTGTRRPGIRPGKPQHRYGRTATSKLNFASVSTTKLLLFIAYTAKSVDAVRLRVLGLTWLCHRQSLGRAPHCLISQPAASPVPCVAHSPPVVRYRGS